MTEILHSYDVFYKSVKKSFFKVKARNEEEARIVADNLLTKDHNWDGKYDAILEYDSTFPSVEPQPAEPKSRMGERYVYRNNDCEY